MKLSYVVIGYNEAPTLGACLRSVREAQMPKGVSVELIFVDGGSQDDSLRIAEQEGADVILGGERRRRASENRNLGLQAAQGEYVQFIDGDMILAPDWPEAAIAFLDVHLESAAVCGNLRETEDSLFSRALEIDWGVREGNIRHCGGAAMYRRAPLEQMGGFPEDVAYGEEPYLCWRIRNELGLNIYQFNHRMVDHGLGFTGFGDYWRRCVRAGATYAEIAMRCLKHKDKLWLREVITNLAWAGGAILLVLGGLFAPGWLETCLLLGVAIVLGRKYVQVRKKGYPISVATLYVAHTYFSKLPIAYGEVKWCFSLIRKRSIQ